jgi:exopolysaccharide biosynthesis WecB/TagA/CpsF family protein
MTMAAISPDSPGELVARMVEGAPMGSAATIPRPRGGPGGVELLARPLEEPARRRTTAPAPVGAGERDAESPERRFAQVLIADLERGLGGTVTWLNHYTAVRSLQDGVQLDRFDYLGLDGLLLCHLLNSDTPRTSADLVLPLVLEHPVRLRIALIGSTAETLQAVATKIATHYGHQVVLQRDGYAGLPTPAELRAELRAARVQVAIVGLGAPLQDHYALAIRSRGVLVATCGGWLDQFAGDAYYPSWAYPLRLNWLVRLAREPRRLWRRYTIDAVRALRSRAELAEYVIGLGHRPLAAASARPRTVPADVSAA